MWWVWVVPALAVAAGLLAAAATGLDAWRRLSRLRQRLGALAEDAGRASEIVGSISRPR